MTYQIIIFMLIWWRNRKSQTLFAFRWRRLCLTLLQPLLLATTPLPIVARDLVVGRGWMQLPSANWHFCACGFGWLCMKKKNFWRVSCANNFSYFLSFFFKNFSYFLLHTFKLPGHRAKLWIYLHFMRLRFGSGSGCELRECCKKLYWKIAK